MDAPLSRRRHEKPAELSELAPNDRKAGRGVRPGSLDHGSRRDGAIPTDFAIRAKNKLGQLLDQVEHGEEIIITRRGRAVASRGRQLMP